ncbi:MAG: SLC13 family permease, partial [Brevundimonas sp.]|uniref:SLC13 family permease n=1 Tax=Brevundimonas sp. TaxID=1871086 RepID=UPI002736C6A8
MYRGAGSMGGIVQQQGEFEDHADGSPGGRSPGLMWTLRAVGVVAAFAVWYLLGRAEGLGADARIVAAVATLMAIWWTTEAVPLTITSLLPIVLMPLLTERTVGETTSPYANPIVFLFLGGFLIAIAMEKWNLHRRVALLTIARVGYQPARIVLGLMLATGFLSMWVSNTATTLMMLPIGLSVLALVSERMTNPDASSLTQSGGEGAGEFIRSDNLRRFGICLTLSIAWSASMGGLGTLLGSPPNAIVAGYAAEQLGRTIGFLEWMMLGTPLALTFILVGWLLMTKVLYRFTLEEIP